MLVGFVFGCVFVEVSGAVLVVVVGGGLVFDVLSLEWIKKILGVICFCRGFVRTLLWVLVVAGVIFCF